jgi:hypothetical protein
MEAVQILRLNDGEDIIALTHHEPGEDYYVLQPMALIVKFDNRTGNQHVMMDHWLPVSIIEFNETVIREDMVLATMQPNAEVLDHYNTAIDKLNKLKTTSSDEDVNESSVDMSSNEMTELLELFDPVGSNQIH